MAVRQPSDPLQAPYHDTVGAYATVLFVKSPLSIASRTFWDRLGSRWILPDASSFAAAVNADVNRSMPRDLDSAESMPFQS